MLTHLADDHPDALAVLTRLLDPELLVDHPDVRPLALDRISDGRLTVHFITGGNDHEQQREGDFLTKDERYARTREYAAAVRGHRDALNVLRTSNRLWTYFSPAESIAPGERTGRFRIGG
ncbi:LLM class flavin-dependent oxidoreductase, partial [Streptomyces sp. BE20]|uniref:LLM class flavin-dependent oxidoreductase n=1 Tax=Streptomyces sp. BE20 TaxID=3002525 RepID=UPI002E76F097